MGLITFFDLAGTLVFAISGVILACRLKMDLFGVLVLAGVTAIGGGTIRDLVLGALPVFWIKQPIYLYIIIIASIFGIMILNYYNKIYWWILPIFDAIGLAVFAGIGVEKTLRFFPDSYFIAVVMGVLTGVGGGIIRDVLAREIPMIFQKEIYATACILGGSIHVILLMLAVNSHIALFIGIISTLFMRLAAIKWNLKLPTFSMKEEKF